MVPNFFRTAGDAPGLIENLWSFAETAYLDNPLPSVFKERLFVHLSRFCNVRYCIVRHVGFLIGAGNPAGDPAAIPESVGQVVDLLRRPGIPDADALSDSLTRLEAYLEPISTPASGTQAEWDVFTAASVLFVNPAQAEWARKALRVALGGATLELLTAYLAFIRMAHYWTETHPDLMFEEDMVALLRQHEELSRLLMDTSEGERGQVGARLFDELQVLRAEHDDRVALREALAKNDEAHELQRLMINELNHRVKNTLAIIQSIAMQTLRGAETPPHIREAFVGRLLALADAHDILTEESWESADIGDVLGKVVSVHRDGDTDRRVSLDGPTVRLTPKLAVAMAMAVHELATNAAKYGALSNSAGRVAIAWGVRSVGSAKHFWVNWTETGGPAVASPVRRGFGSRLIEQGLAGEIGGVAKLSYPASGLICGIEAPLPALDAVR